MKYQLAVELRDGELIESVPFPLTEEEARDMKQLAQSVIADDTLYLSLDNPEDGSDWVVIRSSDIKTISLTRLDDNGDPYVGPERRAEITHHVGHRSLYEIMEDLAQHHRDFPDHGINCIHTDDFMREIRRQVMDVEVEEEHPYSTVRYAWQIGQLLTTIRS